MVGSRYYYCDSYLHDHPLAYRILATGAEQRGSAMEARRTHNPEVEVQVLPPQPEQPNGLNLRPPASWRLGSEPPASAGKALGTQSQGRCFYERPLK